ncbi:hypothetical protein BDR04DRAFT_1139538 [Suillus decipiens]|nr:hypothetical protein BDR04DRAFT_1139538 [Suillus decipiens]
MVSPSFVLIALPPGAAAQDCMLAPGAMYETLLVFICDMMGLAALEASGELLVMADPESVRERITEARRRTTTTTTIKIDNVSENTALAILVMKHKYPEVIQFCLLSGTFNEFINS